MTDPKKYLLKVTAGPSYDNQEQVLVNTSTPAKISTEHIDAHVHVRVKDFRGTKLPILQLKHKTDHANL
jgi:hypothetical protein